MYIVYIYYIPICCYNNSNYVLQMLTQYYPCNRKLEHNSDDNGAEQQ